VESDQPGRLEHFAATLSDAGLPPLASWQPPMVRDMDLHIARDGTWHYLGSPIQRTRLVRLLSKVLRRENEEFFLVSPQEKLRIRVDDAPFIAVEMERLGKPDDQRLVFRTNVNDVVVAGADHAICVVEDSRTGEPAPYIGVRDGLNALISRAVYYELAEIAQPAPAPRQHTLGVTSEGCFFALGSNCEP
jgi:hypothetical protein|tara:strand:+ start:10925 stop:11494 length:570 start_codon:yes stop_codon:yes gene_type:complete